MFFFETAVFLKKLFSRELPPHTQKKTIAVFIGNLFPVKKRTYSAGGGAAVLLPSLGKFSGKTGGLRSGSAGSPGVGERSGTERSNERERRADIATARGARARFLPARRNFLSSGRVFVFGEGGIFCVRYSVFSFFSRAEGGFFPCGLRFRECALFLGRCNLQRMCFWRMGNFCRSKSRSGAEG